MFTHTTKQIHSSAKGTCISVEQEDLPGYFYTGSIASKKLEKNGREDVCGVKATHILSKQVYFGDTLLSPLYPASLANALFERIRLELFGAAAKEARALKRNGKSSDIPVYQFKNLGTIKCGGANPVNVGELSAKQRGIYYYLPALPPRTPLPDSHKNHFMSYAAGAADNTVALYVPETNEWLPADFVHTKQFMQHPAMLALRERVWCEKPHSCYLCGRELTLETYQAEHVKTRKFFWWLALDFDNVWPACGTCNKKKGNSIGMMGEPLCIS